jgi:hypothetical protein
VADLALQHPGGLLLVAGVTGVAGLAAAVLLMVGAVRAVWRWVLCPLLRPRAVRAACAPAADPARVAAGVAEVRYLPCHSTRCGHMTTVHALTGDGRWTCLTPHCGRSTA